MWEFKTRKKRENVALERKILAKLKNPVAFRPNLQTLGEQDPLITTPIVMSSPHSGRIYPNAFLKLSCQPLEALRLIEDAYVDQLLGPLVEMGMPLVSALFPRSYVDVNRERGETPPRPGVYSPRGISPRARTGIGVIPMRIGMEQNIYEACPDTQSISERLAALYDPYHETLRSVLSHMHARFGRAILLDFHSMPSASVAQTRADIIFGTRYGTSCEEQLFAQLKQAFEGQGFTTTRDNPYAGGFITLNYGRTEENQHAVQIEINKHLYMDEQSIQKHQGFDRTKARICAAISQFSKYLGQIDCLAAQ